MGLSVGPQTLADLPPTDFARAVADAGFRHLGVRTLAGAAGRPETPLPSLITSENLSEVRRILNSEGLRARDIEFALLTPGNRIADMEEAIAAGAEMGGTFLVTCCYDPVTERAAHSLAELDALCGRYKVRPLVEFVAYSQTRSLSHAIELVRQSQSNAGVLVDTLHLYRTGAAPDALDRHAADLIPCLQICDGPLRHPETLEQAQFEARNNRLIPGEGEFDIDALLAALPEVAISLEVPNAEAVKELGAVRYLAQLRRKTAALLDRGPSAAKPDNSTRE